MTPTEMEPCKGKIESRVDWIIILNVGQIGQLFSKVGQQKKKFCSCEWLHYDQD
jgi:hypothetical protein